MKKTDAHSFEGLSRIGHPIKQKNNLLWDAHNIRLTTRNGKDSLLSITNERSTKQLYSFEAGEKYVGHVQAGKYLVLFTRNESSQYKDTIYRIELSNNMDKVENGENLIILYKGNILNFNPDYPITGVAVSETDMVFKVYWTDNLNPVSFIDILKPLRLGKTIEDDYDYDKGFTEVYIKTPFNYNPFYGVPELQLKESVEITRQSGNGMFPAGVVQYVLTYSRKYESESNPFWYSPLMYASYEDRGASPEDVVACTFNITVNAYDYNFDYLNVYSIIRTSKNSIPTVKRVQSVDLANCGSTETVVITDSNTTGETVDPNYLLLLQNKNVLAKTMEVKDNTLFLGNITYTRDTIDNLGIIGSDLKLKNTKVLPDYYGRLLGNISDTISCYKNQLFTNTSCFKYGDVYRLGVRFMYKNGEWSKPVWVKDATQARMPYLSKENKGYFLYTGDFVLQNTDEFKEIRQILLNNGYVKMQPLYVAPSISDMRRVAQGVLTSTVFNVYNRKMETGIYAQSSWFFRTDCKEAVTWEDRPDLDAHSPSIHTIFNNYELTGVFTNNGAYASNWHNFTLSVGECMNTEVQAMNYCTAAEIVSDPNERKSSEEDNLMYTSDTLKTGNMLYESNTTDYTSMNAKWSISDVSDYTAYYAVDRELIEMYSPDFEDSEIKNFLDTDPEFSFDVVGSAAFKSTTSMVDIQTSSQYVYSGAKGAQNMTLTGLYGSRHLISGCFFNDAALNKENNNIQKANSDTVATYNWMVYPWSRSETLTNAFTAATDQAFANALKKKTLYNQRFAVNWGGQSVTTEDFPKIYDYQFFNSEDNELTKYNIPEDEQSKSYFGNVDTNIATSHGEGYYNVITPYTVTQGDYIAYLVCSDDADWIASADNPQNCCFSNLDFSGSSSSTRPANIQMNDDIYYYSQKHHTKILCTLSETQYEGKVFRLNGVAGSILSCFATMGVDTKLAVEVEDTGSGATRTAYIDFTQEGMHAKCTTELTALNNDESYTIDLARPYWAYGYKSGITFLCYITLTQDVIYTFESGNTYTFKQGDYFTCTFTTLLPLCLGVWEGNDSSSRSDPPSWEYKERVKLVRSNMNKLRSWNSVSKAAMHFRDLYSLLSVDKEGVDLPGWGFITNGIRMKYKTAPHLLVRLKSPMPWACRNNSNYNYGYGYNHLVDIVQTPVNPYGGTSASALQSNIWIPAGDAVAISSGTLKWTRGDTWFQQYECLKTYPYSLDDYNQIIDIADFYVESRINLDGRYDRNRMQITSSLTPENYNLINPVYSQLDNFFNCQQMDEDYYKNQHYPHQISWSQAKVLGANIDTWMSSLHLMSTTDADVTKGEVRALKTFNSELLCFQDTSFGQVLFNEKVQIETKDSQPIEIANSGKVQGIRAQSTNVGCQDQFHIAVSDKGVYFIDDNTKTFYVYGKEGLVDMNSNLGNYYWLAEHSHYQQWTFLPSSDNETNGIRAFYDPNYKDVYFIPGVEYGEYDSHYEYAMCYSELMGQFSSQMSYGGSVMTAYAGNLYCIASDNNPDKDGNLRLSLWQCFTGTTENGVESYNQIFNKERPFDFTFISVGEDTSAKTFDTIEFKMDSYLNGQLEDTEPNPSGRDPQWYYMERHPEKDTFAKPLTYIEVSNEYQDSGVVKLNDSTLRKKYRVWRLMMPRVRKRERLVNPWVKITMGNDSPGTRSVIIHDLNVNYTM